MQDFNSVQNDKISDKFKVTRFADERVNMAQNGTLGSVDIIVGKGENAGYQHFLLFPQCFQKLLLFKVIKS